MSTELPHVNIPNRILELLGVELDEMQSVRYDGEFTYTFHAGYETLVVQRDPEHGASAYAGVYHPDVVCEGKGVCKWCGRTL